MKFSQKSVLLCLILLVTLVGTACSSGGDKELSDAGEAVLRDFVRTEHDTATDFEIVETTYTDICERDSAICPNPWFCVKITPPTADNYDVFRMTNGFGTNDDEWNVTHRYDSSDSERTLGAGQGRSRCSDLRQAEDD